MFARHLLRKATHCEFRASRRVTSCSLQGPCTTTTTTSANGLSFRLYATRSAADRYLLELLNTEIQQNKHHILPAKSDGKVGTVGPYVLIDKPGTEDVVLSRTVGSQKIDILCMLEKQYSEDEEEEREKRLQNKHYRNSNEQKGISNEGEEDAVEVLHLIVTMTKGEVSLELNCSFVQGASEVMVEKVLFHEPDDPTSIEDLVPYDGPIFEDLDEDLQRAFHELLNDRGLTARVARYMMDYMSSKGKREYLQWLHRLKNFLTC